MADKRLMKIYSKIRLIILSLLTITYITTIVGCAHTTNEKKSSTSKPSEKKSSTSKPSTPIRKIDLSKYIPADALNDPAEGGQKTIYSDLDQDGIEEAVIAYRMGPLATVKAYVKLIGWDGSSYKEIWKSKATEHTTSIDKLSSEDINKSGSKEILTLWVRGAHTFTLQIDSYKNGKVKELGNYQGSNSVALIDKDGDGIKEIEENNRPSDDYGSLDEADITLHKWDGNKYKFWKKYREKLP